MSPEILPRGGSPNAEVVGRLTGGRIAKTEAALFLIVMVGSTQAIVVQALRPTALVMRAAARTMTVLVGVVIRDTTEPALPHVAPGPLLLRAKLVRNTNKKHIIQPLTLQV